MIFLRRILTWPKRRWRAGGFGIHSPFAFAFVTQVLAKRNIDENDSELRAIAGKNYRHHALLYRCVKHFKPQSVVIYPMGDATLTRVVNLANPTSKILAEGDASVPDMTIISSCEIIERDNGAAVYFISRSDKEPELSFKTRMAAECEHGMDFSDYRTWIMCRFKHLPRQSFKIALK